MPRKEKQGRRSSAPSDGPLMDINTTPLIDVMLVLLVIFIITAPLMSSSLKLDLPKAEGSRASETPAFIAVAIDPSGKLYLGEQPVTVDELREQAQRAAGRNPATEVQLRADASVPYGKVAELIGLLQTAGLSKIGFITAGGPAASAPG